MTDTTEKLADGWKPEMGWNGIVPGVSSLDDVINKLGPGTGKSRLSNGNTYSLADGKVAVTVLEGADSISKVWVSGELTGCESVPETADQAVSMFGKLKVTRLDKVMGVIYERPGIRMACDSGSDKNKVRWLEFYDPGR